MKINGIDLTIDITNTVFEIDENDRYALFFIDWCLLDYDTRKQIILSTVGEEEIAAAKNITTLAIVVPRVDGILNMNEAYLHISTFATINPDDIKEFISVSFKNDLSLYKDKVRLEPKEKIELILKLTPCKDMREVI